MPFCHYSSPTPQTIPTLKPCESTNISQITPETFKIEAPNSEAVLVDNRDRDSYRKMGSKSEEAQMMDCIDCCGRREGNILVLWESDRRRQFPFTCLIGPYYCFYMFTHALVLVPSILILVFLYVFLAGDCSFSSPPRTPPKKYSYILRLRFIPWSIGVSVGFAILMCVSEGFLIWTSHSDPGFIPRQPREVYEAQKERIREEGRMDDYVPCERCGIFRDDPSISHCHATDRCVYDLDHTCPWFNQAIARDNIFGFYGFLTSISVQIGYLIICVVVAFASGAFGRPTPSSP